jgi:hypothetical protein
MVFEQILSVFLAAYFKAINDEPLQLDFWNSSRNRSINMHAALYVYDLKTTSIAAV